MFLRRQNIVCFDTCLYFKNATFAMKIMMSLSEKRNTRRRDSNSASTRIKYSTTVYRLVIKSRRKVDQLKDKQLVISSLRT